MRRALGHVLLTASGKDFVHLESQRSRKRKDSPWEAEAGKVDVRREVLLTYPNIYLPFPRAL